MDVWVPLWTKGQDCRLITWFITRRMVAPGHEGSRGSRPTDSVFITELHASYLDITNLEGLQCLTNLTFLNLGDNSIESSAPVQSRESGFTGVTRVFSYFEKITEGFERLTDAEWAAAITTTEQTDVPWMAPIITP